MMTMFDTDRYGVPSRCPACGGPIDYCPGHGEIGDPEGRAILDAHDDGDHEECDPVACDHAPSGRTFLVTLSVDQMANGIDTRELARYGQTVDLHEVADVLEDAGAHVDHQEDVPAEDSEYGYLWAENGEDPEDPAARWNLLTAQAELTHGQMVELVRALDLVDSFVPTMGVLGVGGITPAVAIEQDHDQWTITSCYVTPLAVDSDYVRYGDDVDAWPIDDRYGMPERMMVELRTILHEAY